MWISLKKGNAQLCKVFGLFFGVNLVVLLKNSRVVGDSGAMMRRLCNDVLKRPFLQK